MNNWRDRNERDAKPHTIDIYYKSNSQNTKIIHVRKTNKIKNLSENIFLLIIKNVTKEVPLLIQNKFSLLALVLFFISVGISVDTILNHKINNSEKLSTPVIIVN